MKHILSIIHFVPKLQKKRGDYALMWKGEWFSPNIYLERLRKTTRQIYEISQSPDQ